MKIQNIREAEAILAETTEREAIKCAVYMILPEDGSSIEATDMIDFVHDMIDPIHDRLATSSESYVGTSATGKRNKGAIYATAQWFGPGSTKAQKGRHWIKRNGGTYHYIDDGAAQAAEFFANPKFAKIIETLSFFDSWYKEEPPIVEAITVLDAELPIAAQEVAEKPEPVVVQADSEWFAKMSEQMSELERKVDQLLANHS